MLASHVPLTRIAVIVFALMTLTACGLQEPPDTEESSETAVDAAEQALSGNATQYIVHAATGRSFADLVAAVSRHGGGSIKEIAAAHGIGLAHMPNERAVNALANDMDIASVERDRLWSIPDLGVAGPPSGCTPWPQCKGGGEEPPPPEPTQSTPWGVMKIGAPVAWGTSTGAGVRVAILDTGIFADHPDLDVHVCKNFTRQGGGKDAQACKDGHGHGTHVAGTVAAKNGGGYVVGVAPDVDLWAFKVLSDNGTGWTSDIIAAVYAATDAGADVINMSLGGGVYSQAFDDACAYAESAGVFISAAAGNDGDGDGATDEVGYPAMYASVVSVGATDSEDGMASFSSSNDEVELSAPGVGIESTSNDGGLATYDGTSMATPHVAGAAAVLMGAGADNATARCALTAGAIDFGAGGRDAEYGYGRIDLPNALAQLSSCP